VEEPTGGKKEAFVEGNGGWGIPGDGGRL